jgi:hypothetical protein
VTSIATIGFLPEAFRNFLALLGGRRATRADADRGCPPLLAFMSAAPTRVRRDKLVWFNSYLRNQPLERCPRRSELRRRGCGAAMGGRRLVRARWTCCAARALLTDFATWARAFFSDDLSTTPKR